MPNPTNEELRAVCAVCPDCVEDPCRLGTSDYCKTCDDIEAYTAEQVRLAKLDQAKRDYAIGGLSVQEGTFDTYFRNEIATLTPQSDTKGGSDAKSEA